MRKGKHNALISIFIIYFVLYAVAPLSYAFPEDETYPAAAEPRDAQQISLFLHELLLSNTAPETDRPSDESSPARILVKKKKALVRANTIVKQTATDSCSSALGSTVVPPGHAAAALFPAEAPEPDSGYLSASSGRSPPSL
ncbi:MAG: hypothetical protein AB1805_14370 [Nitrospirota bacterium]